MKSEAVTYSAGSLNCRGQLIYDEAVSGQPLLLMAPNWLGVTKSNIDGGQMLAEQGYVVFVADMFGEGKGPKGDENPMEFLGPLISDAAETRWRISAAFETMTKEASARGVGDARRRAAIGYCFGGANVLDLARAGADAAAVVSVHGVLATPAPAGRATSRPRCWCCMAPPIRCRRRRIATCSRPRWMRRARAGTRSTFGKAMHGYTFPEANNPPVAKYDEPATRHGYTLAHAFIEDAFAGKL